MIHFTAEHRYRKISMHTLSGIYILCGCTLFQLPLGSSEVDSLLYIPAALRNCILPHLWSWHNHLSWRIKGSCEKNLMYSCLCCSIIYKNSFFFLNEERKSFSNFVAKFLAFCALIPNRHTDSFGGGERWLYSFIVQQRGKYSRLVSQDYAPFLWVIGRESQWRSCILKKFICLFAFGYILDAVWASL